MGRRKRTNFSDSLQMNVQNYAFYTERLTELALSMFEWKNLPDTIDSRFLELTLFSDGSDEELQSLLSIPNVERCYFGNAFADMWAISKCKFIIASDSTFSAWGAFLGQRPILFCKRHFPPVYDGRIPEAVLGTQTHLPSCFIDLI